MGKPDCYQCIYRRNIPGDAHSSCVHPSTGTVHDDPMLEILSMLGGTRMPPIEIKGMHVRGNPHGIAHGWFAFPFNFDPVWLEACDGFKEKEEESNNG